MIEYVIGSLLGFLLVFSITKFVQLIRKPSWIEEAAPWATRAQVRVHYYGYRKWGE